MKYECDVIRDLIPLYIDDVASTASRRMVEEHLAECADCRALLGRMKSEEVETAINFEKEDVIAGQRRFFKRRSAVIGSVIAGIFMVPVLICLIVNLASGSGLDWFFPCRGFAPGRAAHGTGEQRAVDTWELYRFSSSAFRRVLPLHGREMVLCSRHSSSVRTVPGVPSVRSKEQAPG